MRKLKKYKQTRFKASDSTYDKVAADYAVSFIESLCHKRTVCHRMELYAGHD